VKVPRVAVSGPRQGQAGISRPVEVDVEVEVEEGYLQRLDRKKKANRDKPGPNLGLIN
jgi:hypothetical protein